MRQELKARILSDLEMEPIVGWILFWGGALAAGFIGAGLIGQWATTGSFWFPNVLQGNTTLQFLSSAFCQGSLFVHWPVLCVDVGIALLMLTPLFRVGASVLYFSCVERNGTYALLTWGELVLLLFVLFFF